jgi:IS5 family transposase
VAATPANVADSTVLSELLHGQEIRVWGDQAYCGQRAVIRERAPKARDFTNRRYRHRGVVDEVERAKKPHQIQKNGPWSNTRSGSSSGTARRHPEGEDRHLAVRLLPMDAPKTRQ